MRSHEASYLLSHHHLRRPDIAMSLRDSFSRLKKKLKHPLTRSKPKSDKTPVGVSNVGRNPASNSETGRAQFGGEGEGGSASNAAAEEHKSNWKSTAAASAKLLLRGVRDTSDAFGPLKSVASGLCFILENCEV